MLLLLGALSHLLVDALCAATIFGPLRDSPDHGMLVMWYNTLAFSTQCIVGLWADRIRRHGLGACLSMLLIVVGYLLPLPGFGRVVCIGFGNSVFHVAGGCQTLEHSRNHAGALGVFVAPGAVGLCLGTLFPTIGPVLCVCMVLCALLMLPVEGRTPVEECLRREAESAHTIPIMLLLTLAVAVRAVGGTAVVFPWKTGIAATLAFSVCVCLGKMVGGVLCDRIGVRLGAWCSLPPAAVLLCLCAERMIPSLCGQFLLNLSMPITLYLLYQAMPDAPGFAFGLAASALWPGTMLGWGITLTGALQQVLILLTFAFGMLAILWAEKLRGQGNISEREACVCKT